MTDIQLLDALMAGLIAAGASALVFVGVVKLAERRKW